MEVGNILSPVIVFVYNRLEHTKNCINSLLANKDSCDSELFIYSDAPKSDSDAKAVVLVREYIKTVKGFKSVSIVEREHNCGLANNIMDGVSDTGSIGSFDLPVIAVYRFSSWFPSSSLLTAPRGISVLAPSFIGSQCQGIPLVLFVA